MGLVELEGLLAGEGNGKSGDFLRSGVSGRERKQACLQKLEGKFEF